MKYAILLATALPVALWGQAATEAALGAARAATTTTTVSKGMGNALDSITGKLDKALKGATAPTASAPTAAPAPKTAAASVPSKPVEPPPPPVVYEDAAGIKEGMPYDEMMKRFGKPSFSIMMADQESLEYQGTAGTYSITARDGKVASVVAPPSKEK